MSILTHIYHSLSRQSCSHCSWMANRFTNSPHLTHTKFTNDYLKLHFLTKLTFAVLQSQPFLCMRCSVSLFKVLFSWYCYFIHLLIFNSHQSVLFHIPSNLFTISFVFSITISLLSCISFYFVYEYIDNYFLTPQFRVHYQNCFLCFAFQDSLPYIVLTGLEIPYQTRLASMGQPACFCLQSAGFAATCHHL